MFCGCGRRFPTNISVWIENRRIKMLPTSTIKYLGITLDPRLNFDSHFQRLEPKLSGTVRALCRLMPNLRGPNEKKRKLFLNVVASIVLYGVPIWADASSSSRKTIARLQRVQRTCAIRAICAYRSVSFAAASLLAGSPPYILMAQMRKRIFCQISDLRGGNAWTLDLEREVRKQERLIMLRQWQLQLEGPELPGLRSRSAVRPHLFRWMSRPWGCLDYYSTQLLTGHGSFGSFLFRIQKAATGACRFCDAAWDSAEHTLRECPRWDKERRSLQEALGCDLNLTNIVGGILGNRDLWVLFTRFVYPSRTP